MKKIILLFLITQFLVRLYSQNFNSCSNWAEVSYGGYQIRNNIWNSGDPNAGSQCTWANSTSDWGCTSTHTNGSGSVKGYPQCMRGWKKGNWTLNSGLPIQLTNLNDASIYWKMEAPNSGRYMALWDIYLHNGTDPQTTGGMPKTNLMIFQTVYDNTNGIPNEIDSYTFLNLDGKNFRFKVYKSSFASGNTITLWELPKNGSRIGSLESTYNLKTIIDYFVAQGAIASNEYLVSVQNGWEIIEGGTYKTTGYYCNLNTEITNVLVNSVSLNNSTLNIVKGNNQTLIASITPTNATNKAISWSSNNNSIVTVNSSGVVSAIAVGTAKIIVTTQDGNKKDTCDVTVTESTSTNSAFISIVNKTFVVANSTSKPIYLNGANTPWHNWNEFGSNNYNQTWWESELQRLKDKKINASRIWFSCDGGGQPSVNSSGIVSTPNAKFWQDCDHLFSQAELKGIYIKATMISFDHFKLNNPNYIGWRAMMSSESNILSYINNYLIPFVNRYKNNPYLFSIDICNEIEWLVESGSNNGGQTYPLIQRFTAMCATAIHNATRNDGSHVLATIGSASVKWNGTKMANGNNNPDGNKFSDAALQSQYNNTKAYLDFYSPHYYTWMYNYYASPFDRTPTQYGMDEKACLVGECPGSGPGTPSMTITQSYDALKSGGWQGHFPWSSNGVDGNGSLTDFGTAALNFSNNNINLIYPLTNGVISVTSISLNPSSVTLNYVGATQQLTPIILPSNATNKNVSYTSNNSSVATVSSSGLITSIAKGNAVITVTTIDGNKTAICNLTVNISTSPNLITNNSFELNVTGWNAPSQFSISTSEHYDSTKSIKMNGTGIYQPLYQTLNVNSNTNYILSAYIKGTANVYMKVFNNSWTTGLAETTILPTSTWIKYSLNFNSSSNTSVIASFMDASSGTSYIDYIELKEVIVTKEHFLMDQSKINIYPIPANNFIKINGIIEATEVNILTLDGKIIKTCNINDDSIIELTNITSGIYILQLKNSNLFLNKKFLKY